VKIKNPSKKIIFLVVWLKSELLLRDINLDFIKKALNRLTFAVFAAGI